ncbi:MAG TPA: dTMP kinase [Terriglobia bacterium]|nr:dTMP kinase [Terriglobia bacterium]
MKRRGILITLEGIDGAGKTTQFRRLAQYLRRGGYPVTATREPGGTRVGEQVRRILLASRNRELTPLAELALMYAARAQHLDEVVWPALARGDLVVSDRFNDSSRAYQGYGRRLGLKTVEAFDRIICGGTQPDLTLVLDVDPGASLGRAVQRETRQKSKHSRFEQAGLEFQRRVRAGYFTLARRDPRRVRIVQADRPAGEVQREIREVVDVFLEGWRSATKGARSTGWYRHELRIFSR